MKKDKGVHLLRIEKWGLLLVLKSITPLLLDTLNIRTL